MRTPAAGPLGEECWPIVIWYKILGCTTVLDLLYLIFHLQLAERLNCRQGSSTMTDMQHTFFFIVLLKYKRPSLKKTYLFFVALIHVHIFQRGWCLYRCAVSTFAFLFVLDGSLLFNSKCSISISVQTFHVFCVLLRIKYDFMRFSKSPDLWNLFV